MLDSDKHDISRRRHLRHSPSFARRKRPSMECGPMILAQPRPVCFKHAEGTSNSIYTEPGLACRKNAMTSGGRPTCVLPEKLCCTILLANMPSYSAKDIHRPTLVS